MASSVLSQNVSRPSGKRLMFSAVPGIVPLICFLEFKQLIQSQQPSLPTPDSPSLHRIPTPSSLKKRLLPLNFTLNFLSGEYENLNLVIYVNLIEKKKI